jgi:hypothetical protein
MAISADYRNRRSSGAYLMSKHRFGGRAISQPSRLDDLVFLSATPARRALDLSVKYAATKRNLRASRQVRQPTKLADEPSRCELRFTSGEIGERASAIDRSLPSMVAVIGERQ